MHRALLPLFFLLLTLPSVAQSAAEAGDLLDAVKAHYDRVNDYSVRLRAVIDATGLSVPPMEATMYFKKPDRLHIESDGFAMLPRDAVGFHPALFDREDYDLVLQGSETVHGVTCTKVKLLARSDTLRLQRATLCIDPKRALILRMDFDPGAGASATADFSYAQVDGKYWLPSRIDIDMQSPMGFRRPGAKSRAGRNSGNSARKDGKARIRMTYDSYVVNKGIPDAMFESGTAATPGRGRK